MIGRPLRERVCIGDLTGMRVGLCIGLCGDCVSRVGVGGVGVGEDGVGAGGICLVGNGDLGAGCGVGV